MHVKTVSNDRQRLVSQLIWREGAMSRSQISQRAGLHPNLVGDTVTTLLERRVLREAASESPGTGRPRTPLEIDPQQRTVIGLAISPGQVQAARLNLRGGLIGTAMNAPLGKPNKLIAVAQKLLRPLLQPSAVALGISVTGFVDQDAGSILFSSAAPELRGVSLEPLMQMAQSVRHADEPMQLVLDNDMHAVAARWVLTHRADSTRDTLLVMLDDGRIGASMLIAGRPNRGCVVAGNELGHMRLAVETDKCYCGRSGCLERIFSTAYFHQLGGAKSRSLANALAEPRSDASRIDRILRHVADGIANAVNFMRPAQLVLISSHARKPAFSDSMQKYIRGALLPELADRIRLDWWDEDCVNTGETAAWLGLASLYCADWDRGL